MTLSETESLAPNGIHQNTWQTESADVEWRYTKTQRLKKALHKASSDFRSDVVTVPTTGMMQVSDECPFLPFDSSLCRI